MSNHTHSDDSQETLPTLPDDSEQLLSLASAKNFPLLLVMRGVHLGEFFLLEAEESLLGRSSKAQIRLDDEGSRDDMPSFET